MAISDQVRPSGIRCIADIRPDRGVFALNGAVLSSEAVCPDEKTGLAHAYEHMLFKGTRAHDELALSRRGDGLGAYLNAVTHKDAVEFIAMGISGTEAKLAELISEMLSESAFDQEAWDVERQTILSELRRAQDSPGTWSSYMFESVVWAGTPLGQNSIGTVESLEKMSAADLASFGRDNAVRNNIVVFATGECDVESIALGLEGAIGDGVPWVADSGCLDDPPTLCREMDCANVMLRIGGLGEPVGSPEHTAQQACLSILGEGSSSRLVRELRQKRGWCYSCGATEWGYPEGVAWMLYADLAPVNVQEAVRIMRGQLANLATDGPSDEEFEVVRAKAAGDIMRGADSVRGNNASMSYWTRMTGKPVSRDERRLRWLALRPEDITTAAAALMGTIRLAAAMILPQSADALSVADPLETWRATQ